MVASSADARGGPIIAKGPGPLRRPGPRGSPTRSAVVPSRTVRVRPTSARARGAAPSAAAARRAAESGGRGPTNHAGPPAKRTSAAPGDLARNTTDTGGGGASSGAPAHRPSAPAASAADGRRRGQASPAPSRSAYAASSCGRHGRSSTDAHGSAAARAHTRSKAAKPASAAFAASGAAAGSRASHAHSAPPAPMSSAASGTSARLASGPTTDPRPNTAAYNGHSAAAMARLIPSKVQAARAGRAQRRGADASSLRATASRAAVPPKLIHAPVESAAPGSHERMSAAAKVKVADGVVCRSSARAAAAAVSISQARTLGGSAPAISA